MQKSSAHMLQRGALWRHESLLVMVLHLLRAGRFVTCCDCGSFFFCLPSHLILPLIFFIIIVFFFRQFKCPTDCGFTRRGQTTRNESRGRCCAKTEIAVQLLRLLHFPAPLFLFGAFKLGLLVHEIERDSIAQSPSNAYGNLRAASMTRRLQNTRQAKLTSQVMFGAFISPLPILV